MIDFNINYKKFNKHYKQSIIDGIIERYTSLYYDDNITVTYKVERSLHTFSVSKNFIVIDKQGLVTNDILLKKYNNIDAIELFSSIPMNDYLKEYDDSTKNYKEYLINKLESLVLYYKIKGLDNITMSVEYDRINIQVLGKSYVDCCFINNYFHFNNIITKEEYQTFFNRTKRALEKTYQSKFKN